MVVDLKTQIQEAMKMAMRSHAKERLGVIRLILAAIKQQEVDKRIQLSEEQVLEILAKMVKQRKESIVQFQPAGREDLIAKENFEILVISEFLPKELSVIEIENLIELALTELNASSIKDMAKVMKYLRDQLIGRADLEEVGKLVKNHLLKV